MNKYRIRKKLTNFIVHACLTILALVWIFPLFWVIMTSFRAGKGSYSSTFLPDKLRFIIICPFLRTQMYLTSHSGF